MPTVGVVGVKGCVFITTLEDAVDEHPVELVTVKLRAPAVNPDIVTLAPVPAIAPGLIVQFPDGKPFNNTLPVGVAQVVCVIVPTNGADGIEGWLLIVIFAVAGEVQPIAFVTLKECVPATNPDTVLLVPDPAIAPGLIVQFPAGRFVRITLPVADEQFGCVIVLNVGAEGVSGCVLIKISAVGNEIHPELFVTV